MTLKGCPRENEVRDLTRSGQWPQACSDDLKAHVAACRVCSDLALVAEAFRKARAESTASARLLPPGILWWRAQLRRRNAAVERLSRPILGAEIFALAFTLLAGVGFIVFEALTSDAWQTWLQQLPQSAAAHWDAFLATGAIDPRWGAIVLLPAVATLVLVGGVAVYMATDR
jgi:hypothetical protein